MKPKLKVLVVGNATIDAYPRAIRHNIEGSVVHIHDSVEGRKLEIICEEELRKGGKHFAREHLFFQLQGVLCSEKFGGGGLNSVRELSKIVDWELSYLDMSTPSLDTREPGRTIAGYLSSMHITPIFLSTRPVPLNLVLGTRDDKVIIKSPLQEQVGVWTPENNDLKKIIGFIINHIGYDAILFNSIKDEGLAEYIIESEPQKMAVITRSLEPEFVLSRVLPECLCQFNYDEFGYIIYNEVIGDEEERFEAAIEGIQQLRSKHKLEYPVFVTLGKNGTLVADRHQTYHIRLNTNKYYEVQEFIRKNSTDLTGAGDVFAAHVFKAWLLGYGLLYTAVMSSMGAIKHLGYHDLKPSDFWVGVATSQKPSKYWVYGSENI
ncbi:hypothetical protein DRJ48_02225 [Candidatus Woesearchaeota archaeon]|nr:hypothetical protein [Candidatus Woesearchaeota archaeon]RLE42960.1 MAG: hypothetical protein DRJ48_02225 [Candidatus Woesearchaeota archaeon]